MLPASPMVRTTVPIPWLKQPARQFVKVVRFAVEQQLRFHFVGNDHINQVQIIDDEGIAREVWRRIEHGRGACRPPQLQRKHHLRLRDFKVKQQNIACAEVSKRLADMFFADQAAGAGSADKAGQPILDDDAGDARPAGS